ERQIAARVAEQVKERVAVSKVLWEEENEERNAAAVKKAVEKAQAAAEAQFQRERKRWEDESLRSFVDAEERWREEAADRLAAARAEWEQTARPVEPGSAPDPLAMMERDPFAAPERETRPVEKRPTNRTWRRMQNAALLAGCLAAVLLVYPVLKPLLVEEWLPKIEALVADSGLLPPTGPQAPPTAEQRRMTVATNAANLRAGPSTGSQVITTLGRNTSVTVLERRGTWVLVEVADDRTVQGWLHDSLVRSAAER
ncbi:MAG: SH3 domain-containing protein, partial [Kiloniellales bacterium]